MQLCPRKKGRHSPCLFQQCQGDIRDLQCGDHRKRVDLRDRGAISRGLSGAYRRHPIPFAGGRTRRRCHRYVASIGLVERCGFETVGVHRRHGQLDDVWRDVLVAERLLDDDLTPGEGESQRRRCSPHLRSTRPLRQVAYCGTPHELLDDLKVSGR